MSLTVPTFGAANMTVVCGDSVCDATEDCGSCSEDCGACPDVAINEVLPVPATGDDAFIELYNKDAVEVDLTGWTLTDGVTAYTFPDPSAIGATAFLVLDENTTGITLTASGALDLVDPDGVTIDSSDWADLMEGESWSRLPDGGPFFQITSTPTPGAANVGDSTGGGCATGLFFSEYVEGSSNNKAIEIANFTGSEVDLADYQLWLADNGKTFEAANKTQVLSGMLADGAVIVLCNGSFSNEACTEASGTVNHNGNDAYALVYAPAAATPVIIDRISVDGLGTAPQPGDFDVAGVTGAGKDHTLQRKTSVTGPNDDWAVSAGTTADDSEWIVLDKDFFGGLGSHIYGGTCP